MTSILAPTAMPSLEAPQMSRERFTTKFLEELMGEMSPEELARKSGIPAPTIYEWLRRGLPSQFTDLQKLSQALGVGAGRILGEAPDHELKAALQRIGKSREAIDELLRALRGK